MTGHGRGTGRLGRRAKRFLTPLRKYEIWLQLVRGETTIGEAADRFEVDRSTIMRLRTVAKDGAVVALAESELGAGQVKRDLELEAARAEAARLGEALKELAVKLLLVEGRRAFGADRSALRATARASTAPLIPPALVPEITSTVTSVSSSCLSSKYPSWCRRGSWPAWTSWLISLVSPPIQIARLTPPVITVARRNTWPNSGACFASPNSAAVMTPPQEHANSVSAVGSVISQVSGTRLP
jgi:transposase